MSETQRIIREGTERLQAQADRVQSLADQLDWERYLLAQEAGDLGEFIEVWVCPDEDPAWIACPQCGVPNKITHPKRTGNFIASYKFVSVCSDCA